jgi:putative transposase
MFARLVARRMPMERNSRGEYALWQRRFWEHTIRDESDFERHADYIHVNPVKHGLVSRVTDWRYSSFHRYVRLGLVPRDWGGDVPDAGHNFGERLLDSRISHRSIRATIPD